MTTPNAPNPPARVLIVKPSSLGDVVSALPVLRGLRRAFPGAYLAWLVADTCAPLFEGDPDLDEAVVFRRKAMGPFWRSPRAAGELRRLNRRLRDARFDWVIELQGLFRSAYFAQKTRAPLRAGFARPREPVARRFYTQRVEVTAEHTVDRNCELARALGVAAGREDMTLHVPEPARQWAEGFLAEVGLSGRPYLVGVPPARWQSKRYPVRHWRAVARELTGRAPLLLLGAPGDEALCAEIAQGIGGVTNAAGRTTIPRMVALIAASSGVICGDSAAEFIAPAVGTPAVVLIGPTSVERTGPVSPGRAIVADVPCQGCLKRVCGHRTCMELIDPRGVVEAAAGLL